MNIYIKYYPKDYLNYPSIHYNPQWYWTFQEGSGYFIHNNVYDNNVSGRQVILPPARYVNIDVYFTDFSVNYTSTLGSFLFTKIFTVKDTFYANRGITDFYKSTWTEGVDWSPSNLTSFKNNCVTFIQNNNPYSWNDINLDIWVEQKPTGVTQDYSHIFLYYEGNNPVYDELVSI